MKAFVQAHGVYLAFWCALWCASVPPVVYLLYRLVKAVER